MDAIIWATGYKITFPFFDPEFISAPDNRFPLYKRIFVPGIDDLAFIGFAQTVPTLFPFVELQSKLVARYLNGDYAPPSLQEMEETIRRDQERHFGRSPTGRATRCRSTGTSTSTTSGTARSRRDASEPPEGWRRSSPAGS